MLRGIEDLFPGLRGTAYRITGPPDSGYNCIAWAAEVSDIWWWPTGGPQHVYWPPSAPREETVAAVAAAFASLGYIECQDAELESSFQKIAIFAKDGSFPTHAARQLSDGFWTSKLGQLECIEHALHDLEGVEYGSVVTVMKRRIQVAATI